MKIYFPDVWAPESGKAEAMAIPRKEDFGFFFFFFPIIAHV